MTDFAIVHAGALITHDVYGVPLDASVTSFAITHPVATDRLGVANGGTPVEVVPAGTPLRTTALDTRRRCQVCGDVLILSGWCDSCLRFRPAARQAVRDSR